MFWARFRELFDLNFTNYCGYYSESTWAFWQVESHMDDAWY